MKNLYTLAVLLFACYVSLPAQVETEFPMWESPEFSTTFLRRHRIKAVRVTTEHERPGKKVHQSQAHYAYNERAQLAEHIEWQGPDTSFIHRYHYNERGVLVWKQTTDKVWKKNYRSGYRFTSNQTIFQVKSYELLRNDERMLLDTRQYIYDTDSQLVAIRSMEQNRVVRVQRYTYTPEGQIAQEILENASGDTIRSVSYRYDAQGRIVYTQTDAARRQTFHYAYADNGQPLRIEWLEDDQPRGVAHYTYNEEGFLVQLDRELVPQPGQPTHIRQTFSYETY
ncbi:MAG: hypothetical protein D6722_29280 [Bacteroidetes bacterium]|nr:MAG: hypothetical protein D6722_29280 [Bacteroidota bacterium]